MILDCPNHFGRVQIVLDRPNSFWTAFIKHNYNVVDVASSEIVLLHCTVNMYLI